MRAVAGYHLLMAVFGFLLPLWLFWRLLRGREIRTRLRERRGHAGQPRPDAPLLWIHAVSIGETISVLPLIDDIHTAQTGLSVLLTTNTRTSAEIAARHAAKTDGWFMHQFVPLDHAPYVARFLAHWRPALALFVESEIWPNMLARLSQGRIPVALINGRLSPTSFRRWQAIPESAAELFGHFSLLTAQDETTATRLKQLTDRPIEICGNLKLDAPPLSGDAAELAALTDVIGVRPCWLAASTHAGEEELAADAHINLTATLPDLLTLVAPRHPERGDGLANHLRDMGLMVAQRSKKELPTASTQIYLLDTIGEMGVFYRAVETVFIGGTLVEHGGQNPLEAARLNCAIMYGLSTENFTEIFANMVKIGAAYPLDDRAALTPTLTTLLLDGAHRQKLIENAAQFADNLSGARAHLLALLAPYLGEIMRHD